MDSDFLDDDLDVGLLEEIAKQKKTLSKPTHHVLDRDQLSTYIYPTNLPIRDYQYSIVHRALFHNVLVVLPTGLGKTFIASTVMLNFLRWFPQLKIIFMAPTKPLVAQQIKACCGITGLPQSKVAIMLDRTRKNRVEVWADKSVFFTTPQVVENDLAAGIVNPKLIVLLVVDEAHSAKGNYAYNNVVKFVSRFLNSFRILALTATPAADVDGVQEIVDNLHISYVEARSERSIDIFKYLNRKKVERITVEVSDEVQGVIDALCEAAAPILRTANEKGIYEVTDPARINAYTALDAQRRVAANKGMLEGLKWSNYFIIQLLIVVGQCLRRLNIYGVRSFYEYFSEKHAEFSTKYNMGKSKNHMAAKFYFHPSVKSLLARSATLVSDPKFLGSPKLAIVVSELGKFFENTSDDNSRVIIFTEFRLSASDIVRAIENTFASVSLRPHIFIGQAKEKDRFDEEKYAKKGMKRKGASKKGQDTANKTSSELAQQSGMNQKQQKQVIKDFKSGKHNVLVATSIGEEGLDIGEVDLIICFDSTSSPIKNIQRMGRTGRSRDGKVILLFSMNEETKFDKAIAGYEYIQEHIMKGLVKMNEQNRILPKDVAPVVEERKIEIPRENMDIVKEEDEDEIIRLATQCMATQTGKRASKGQTKLASARSSNKSVQKRFFMPDDVETGFRPARAVLCGEDPEAKRQRISAQGADFLDSLLDSDDEQLSVAVDTATVLPAGVAATEPAENVEKCANREKRDDHGRSNEVRQDCPAEKKQKKQLGPLRPRVLIQQEIFNWRHSSGVTHLPNVQKSFSAASGDNSAASGDKSPDVPLEGDVQAAEKSVPDDGCSDDDFSDDDEILALVKRTQSIHNSLPEREKTSQLQVLATDLPTRAPEAAYVPKKSPNSNTHTEKVYTVKPGSGILSDAEKQELYLHYYTTPDDSRTYDYCSPLDVRQDGHAISHSRKAQKHLAGQLFQSKLTNKDAQLHLQRQ